MPREHLLADRAGYFEQLRMYCALADTTRGRLLVVVDAPEGGAPEIEAVDCRFSDLPGLRHRMAAAAARFRAALTAQDPASLPRCPWFDRGCGFRQAGVCTCSGKEMPESLVVAHHLEGSEPNERVIAEVRDRIASGAPSLPEARAHGYRELIYLRRGYFERTHPEAGRPFARAGAEGTEGPGLYQLLREAIESREPPGLHLPPNPEEPGEERLLRLDGTPALIKTSRALGPPRLEEFPDRHPWYFLELGLRCAALGRDAGWLAVGYERLRAWEAPVRVLKVSFEPLLPWREELGSRRERLAAALRAGSPAGLPACPEWMFEGCPYQPGCGEGEPPACRRIR